MSNVSHSDYLAMQARLAGRASPTMPADAHEGPESQLHEQIRRRCQDNGWIAFHGSMAHRTHRTLGEPDWIILMPNRVLFVECKTAKGKLTSEQQGMALWASKLGHTIHTVRSFDQFLSIIK